MEQILNFYDEYGIPVGDLEPKFIFFKNVISEHIFLTIFPLIKNIGYGSYRFTWDDDGEYIGIVDWGSHLDSSARFHSICINNRGLILYRIKNIQENGKKNKKLTRFEIMDI